jgi:hypothetical protein
MQQVISAAHIWTVFNNVMDIEMMQPHTCSHHQGFKSQTLNPITDSSALPVSPTCRTPPVSRSVWLPRSPSWP